MTNPKTPMNPIRIQATRMMGTLVEIEEEITEEGMTEEGIAIAIAVVMSLTGAMLTGVGLAAEEGIHHPIHPIHPIRTMTMTSTDADAPARIATIDVETAVETDPHDNPHPSSTKAPRSFRQARSDSLIPIKTRFTAFAINSH